MINNYAKLYALITSGSKSSYLYPSNVLVLSVYFKVDSFPIVFTSMISMSSTHRLEGSCKNRENLAQSCLTLMHSKVIAENNVHCSPTRCFMLIFGRYKKLDPLCASAHDRNHANAVQWKSNSWTTHLVPKSVKLLNIPCVTQETITIFIPTYLSRAA